MLFLQSGEVLYDCSAYVIAQQIQAPTCVSEATLWMKWVHCGNLLANSHCEVLLVDAVKFESQMVQMESSSHIMRNLRKYALQFLEHV